MKKHYRIVRDRFAGYEVQTWRWWFPFWVQSVMNTHVTVERAEAYAREHARSGGVVKTLCFEASPE